MSDQSYPIRLTRLAGAIAETRYSRAQVEQTARDELAKLATDAHKKIIQHCFRITDAVEFICLPDPRTEDGIVVDLIDWQILPPLTEGPFAGKSLQLPRPASEDRDEEW